MDIVNAPDARTRISPMFDDEPYCNIDSPAVPQSFKDTLKYVDLLICRELVFDKVYRSTAQRSQVPAMTPCMVDCRPAWCNDQENRVLAFAVRVRGHIRWYGVISQYSDPCDLAGVKSFVPVSEVLEDCLHLLGYRFGFRSYPVPR